MKKGFFFPIFATVFLFLSLFFIYDGYCSYREYVKHKEIIESIRQEHEKIEREIYTLKQKIEHFERDPKAAEEILRTKYKMLKPDQFIPKNDDDN